MFRIIPARWRVWFLMRTGGSRISGQNSENKNRCPRCLTVIIDVSKVRFGSDCFTCTHKTGIIVMIKSFSDKETEKIFDQHFSRRLPQNIQQIALRKMIMIDNAGCLEDLMVPPGNRLDMLQGDRKGRYSIRINQQYRICFRYRNGDFYDVEIIDYH